MFIGIDIGGYKINGVLIKKNRIIERRKLLIPPKSNKKIIITQIFDCIEYLIKKSNISKIKGIGIGVPGLVDFEKQKILNLPNVPAIKNLFLAKIIFKRFGIKTRIDNDSNCFGLAEAILGTGKYSNLLVGLTLGTGIGGAIIINKKIFHGASGSGAEFGHMKIEKDGWQCSCGEKGCLEAYVSGKGIMRIAKGVGCNGATPVEIEKMAKKGDKKAIKVYEIAGEYLGIGLANIVNILNPKIIVIGGGIANAGELIFKSAREVMRKNVFSHLAKRTKIIRAKLGRDAGAIGAALLIK